MANKLILVGVGHVFDIGKKVEDIIRTEKPDAIALELDEERAIALSQKEGKTAPNFIYSLFAKIQQIIAAKFKVEVGNEMLAAIKVANEMNIPILFIDMNARHVIQKLWKKMGLKKKISILLSSFTAFFMSKERVEKEIKNFEKEPEKFNEKMREIYPEISEILIDERNRYMAKELIRSLGKYEKIVAIVGEGHISGLKEILEKEEIDLEIIHLSKLLE